MDLETTKAREAAASQRAMLAIKRPSELSPRVEVVRRKRHTHENHAATASAAFKPTKINQNSKFLAKI